VSKLSKLKSAKSRIELAQLIGYKPASLTSIIYKTNPLQKYTTFTINKKSGGTRTIKAPIPKLKKLQSHLSDLLYQCLEEIEKERDARPISFGFRKDRAIIDNAARHKRRRWVLNLDLEDFFPTFNFGRVRGYFLKDKAFSLNEEVATTIAQIACDGGALPQGSPCSPVISELIAQILDMALIRLAKKYKVTYTRYADDITFSTNQKEFPSGLATPDGGNPQSWQLSDELTSKITTAGFHINNAKTRMQFRGSRQMVTGLVVNEKVNVPSDYYRRSRSMCDSLFQTGKYYKSTLPPKKPGDDPEPDWTASLNPLEGILGYIYYITQSEERREISEQRKTPRAIRKLYRRFLFYKYCIALQKPLIITEGKTDPIYLKAAIKSRASFYPQLGSKGKDGFEHAIKYFKYSKAEDKENKPKITAHEIMDLGGGTGDLRSIPLEYSRNLKKHKGSHNPIAHKPMRHPVIIVLDNDDGLGAVASTIKKSFKVSIDLHSTADFYHVTDNLYVVKTPENGTNHTCIEDLFPDDVRNKDLKGKRLNTASKIDPENDLSKEAFANSIVKPNAANIDFSGFDPLLNRICKVIEHYAPQP
jgi:RNA-directed DNA polymerase